MNTKKRMTCFLAAVIFIMATLIIPASAKTSEEADRHLQYNENGKFTIMHITDIHNKILMRKATKELLKAELKANPCDLIVITGDNIKSSSHLSGIVEFEIWQFMSEIAKTGTPVAVTFGNHDAQDSSVTKSDQLRMFEKYDNFIGCAGEDLGDSNLCTYYVPIYSSGDANDPVNIVWIVDSGDYNTENELGGYAATTKAQVDWYKSTSESLEQQYGRKIPGLMFQHIVVPEIWGALKKADENTPCAVKYGENYYVLPDGAKGIMAEKPCPPNYSNGQFDAVSARGDVMAMFFGHDHTNTFEIKNYKGVDLVNTPSIGFESYSSEDIGVRMIYLDENKPGEYETEVVSYFDVFDPDDDEARYLYESGSSTFDELTNFASYFKYVFARIEKFFSAFSICPIKLPIISK